MNKEILLSELINQVENEKLEFKIGYHKEEIAKIICSFLNGEGGQLILGVREKGIIIGQKDAARIIDELQKYLLNSIIPEPAVTVTNEQIKGKEIIIVKVWGGSIKPYVFDGTIYYRKGPQTIKASSQAISDLIRHRQETEIIWERQPVIGAEISDFDTEEIRKTISYINETRRSKNIPNDTLEFLRYFNLYSNDSFTNAAMLLFGKEPSRFIPQSRVRFTVFSKGKTDARFLEDKMFEKNIFKNIEDLQDVLKKYVSIESNFSNKNWQRADKFVYPIDALREGILNAVIHSDYSVYSGSISIQIFPDRIEIANYGKLPDGITVLDLKRNHASYPHNPDIAHICYLRGYIEKIGRGTLSIIEACKKQGLKDPKWEIKANMVMLKYFGSHHKPREISTNDLNDRRLKFLREVKEGDQYTVSKYLSTIGSGLTDRSARSDLAILVEGGWFKKRGKGRNTVYIRTELNAH